MAQFNPKVLAELVDVNQDAMRLWEGREVASHMAHAVFSRACSVFRSMSNDHEFKVWLHDAVVAGCGNYEPDAVSILQDVDKYMYFMQIERSILTEAGVSSQTADLLLHHMTLFRNNVLCCQAVSDCTYDSLSRDLSLTADRICGVAGEIKETAQRHKIWVFARKLGLEVGGWTVVAANSATFVTGLVATSGLSLSVGGVSLLSTALGRSLIVASNAI